MTTPINKMTPEDWRTLYRGALGEIPPLSIQEYAKVTHLAPSTVRKIILKELKKYKK